MPSGVSLASLRSRVAHAPGGTIGRALLAPAALRASSSPASWSSSPAWWTSTLSSTSSPPSSAASWGTGGTSTTSRTPRCPWTSGPAGSRRGRGTRARSLAARPCASSSPSVRLAAGLEGDGRGPLGGVAHQPCGRAEPLRGRGHRGRRRRLADAPGEEGAPHPPHALPGARSRALGILLPFAEVDRAGRQRHEVPVGDGCVDR
mmetsp:Transcript_57962/g.180138  ORF Transcript_57962/g.180138 Transcript_57962/m.180138 type:complete len:204 (+) Transcript_57962:222-833(+)